MTRFRNESSPSRAFLLAAGAVVFALLLWAVMRSGVFSNSTAQVVQGDSTITGTPLPLAVSNYLLFTAERSASQASASHTYSADGFRHLAAALESLASGADVADGAREIRARADSMQQNQAATTHAHQAREAALVASTLLGRIQEARRPEFAERFRQVNDAATAISADRRLLDQANSVQTFFERSAQVILDLSS